MLATLNRAVESKVLEFGSLSFQTFCMAREWIGFQGLVLCGVRVEAFSSLRLGVHGCFRLGAQAFGVPSYRQL